MAQKSSFVSDYYDDDILCTVVGWISTYLMVNKDSAQAAPAEQEKMLNGQIECAQCRVFT
jgi:hypothetical protein